MTNCLLIQWREKKIGTGGKIKCKKDEGGEKLISTNLFLGADLENGGHNKGGGNIPEAYVA